jgi:hypothetical protein
MLLTEKKAKPGTTGKAQELLRILRENAGQWMSRSDIAAAVEKTRLNPNDIRQLDMMADVGMIERRKSPVAGPVLFEWQYQYKIN